MVSSGDTLCFLRSQLLSTHGQTSVSLSSTHTLMFNQNSSEGKTVITFQEYTDNHIRPWDQHTGSRGMYIVELSTDLREVLQSAEIITDGRLQLLS